MVEYFVAPKRKPGVVRKALNYAAAYASWLAAGRPVRSQDEQARIAGVCRACPRYVPHRKPGRPGSCEICGCQLNINGDKIRFATEQCPDDPPRWLASAGPLAQNTPTRETDMEDQPAKKETRAERIARRDARIKARQELEARNKATAEAAKASPEGPPRPQEVAPDAPGQAPRQSRAERLKARADRIERRRLASLAMGGEKPPIAKVLQVEDPLLMYDRAGQPIGHYLRGLWQGCAAFYVCGGPSLRELDLSFLRHRGVVSMGINNVGGFAPVRAWTFSDPAEKFMDRIFLDPAIVKFVPRAKLGNRIRTKLPDGRFQWTSYEVKHCPAVFSYDRETHFYPEQFLTTTWATWGPSKKHKENEAKPTVLFTFFLGLRLLHYLGVRRVYLLGADFGMSADKHYAFGQDRHQGAVASNNNSYRVASHLLGQVKPVFDAAGFEVYQTNERSALKVFDHVPLADAVADARNLIPPEPWPPEAFAGWYEKIDPRGQPTKNQSDDRGE